MIVLNFSHPLTQQHIEQIRAITGQSIEQVTNVPVQFKNEEPFVPQLKRLMENITLSDETWKTKAILVNLPSLNYIAAMLLTELYWRMGYFPPILRMRPVAGSLPPSYEVAEVIDLSARV